MKGYTYKKDRQKAAQELLKAAQAEERGARDAEYAADQARAKRTLLADLVPGGPEACAAAVKLKREQVEALKGVDKPSREQKQTLRRLEGEVVVLAPLGEDTAQAGVQALEAARLEVESLAATAAAEKLKAAESLLRANEAVKAANDIKDLKHKAWEKDQTEDGSVRAQETALYEMREELQKLGANAPPGAVQHCDNFQALIDARAHKAKCGHCTAVANGVNADLPPVTHAIERSAAAKTALTDLLDRLDALAAKKEGPEVVGLSEADVRDRNVGLSLKKMLDKGSPKPGKMIGVLLCSDGTVYKAFSGDIDGADDVGGWATHIPPATEGGTLNNANGVVRLLDTFPDVGTPHGVCAAPKLIQQAYRDGKTPVGLAEAWYGQPGGGKFHRGLVVSCATCMENLGFQLCTVERPVT